MIKENSKLQRENEHLKCVMRAAAIEIRSFWHVHERGGVAPFLLLEYLEGHKEVTADHNPYPEYLKAHKSSRVSKV